MPSQDQIIHDELIAMLEYIAGVASGTQAEPEKTLKHIEEQARHIIAVDAKVRATGEAESMRSARERADLHGTNEGEEEAADQAEADRFAERD